MTGCDRIFQQQHRNKNWRDHGRQHAATYYHKRCSWRTYFHLLGIFGTVTRTARRSARKRTAVHAMVRILLEHPKAQYSSMLLRPWPVCLISRIQGHEITFTISRTLFPSSRAQTLVREETVHKSPCHAKSIQIHLNPVFMPVSSWYIPKKLRSNGLSLSLSPPPSPRVLHKNLQRPGKPGPNSSSRVRWFQCMPRFSQLGQHGARMNRIFAELSHSWIFSN